MRRIHQAALILQRKRNWTLSCCKYRWTKVGGSKRFHGIQAKSYRPVAGLRKNHGRLTLVPCHMKFPRMATWMECTKTHFSPSAKRRVLQKQSRQATKSAENRGGLCVPKKFISKKFFMPRVLTV